MVVLYVLVPLVCLERHQIVDLNVWFIKNVHQIEHVLHNNAKIRALVHVVLMPDVRHKIINLYAHALKDLKVIHMLVALHVKVSTF